jgi:hypothetical protein
VSADPVNAKNGPRNGRLAVHTYGREGIEDDGTVVVHATAWISFTSAH